MDLDQFFEKLKGIYTKSARAVLSAAVPWSYYQAKMATLGDYLVQKIEFPTQPLLKEISKEQFDIKFPIELIYEKWGTAARGFGYATATAEDGIKEIGLELSYYAKESSKPLDPKIYTRKSSQDGNLIDRFVALSKLVAEHAKARRSWKELVELLAQQSCLGTVQSQGYGPIRFKAEDGSNELVIATDERGQGPIQIEIKLKKKPTKA